MRDPYLYDDVDVLKNRANIKETELLRTAEADITNLAMTAIYDRKYDKFNLDTLLDIHRTIFGQIYDWGGEFRTIMMTKPEDVLGGDTVRYAYPKEIKKQLAETMKEVGKLKRTGDNDRDIVFRLTRIIAAIWQTHPFREGNTRTVLHIFYCIRIRLVLSRFAYLVILRFNEAPLPVFFEIQIILTALIQIPKFSGKTT